MLVDHDGPVGGHVLRFTSSLDHLEPDLTLRYGRSLIDFSPRISTVGQIASVGGFVWIPAIKMTFIVTLGFDWDRMALTLSIYPGIVPIGMPAERLPDRGAADADLDSARAGRRADPRLNNRLTASRLDRRRCRARAGDVLRIEGIGEEFGGLYRATADHAHARRRRLSHAVSRRARRSGSARFRRPTRARCPVRADVLRR